MASVGDSLPFLQFFSGWGWGVGTEIVF